MNENYTETTGIRKTVWRIKMECHLNCYGLNFEDPQILILKSSLPVPQGVIAFGDRGFREIILPLFIEGYMDIVGPNSV